MFITSKILSWVIRQWYTNLDLAHPTAEWWLLQVRYWYSTKGFLWTIAHIKSIRLHITRYICGQPLLEPQGSVGIYASGLPKGVDPLLGFLSTNRGRSFVLTLLNISRCLPGTKKPDLSTITDSWSGYISYQLREFIPLFIELNNIPRFESKFTLLDMMNSNKSGPLGVTTQTSVLQAYHALQNLGPDLANITGGDKGVLDLGSFTRVLTPILKPLHAWRDLSLRKLNLLSQIFHSRSPSLVTYLRKLSIVNDPEGKARIICIFDYWSQLGLKGIHNWAFDILRQLPCDRTFDQDPFMIKKEGPYYSVDLTAATDRFPLELQRLLLENLSSKAVADSWARILSSQDVYVPWLNSTVKYAAGQPMGAYSSWAVFALTHHLVVQFSAHSVGKTGFADYMLLGDDIVIADKAVAEKYISVLSELGVGISLHKTHVSDDTYEFAKRWIKKGVEISGIPLRGLISSGKKYYLLAPMLLHLINTIHPSEYRTVPDLVQSFFQNLGFHLKHSIYFKNRTAEFLAVYRYVKFSESKYILDLIKSKDTQWHPFPEPGSKDSFEYLDWLLERTVMVEILKANDTIKNYGAKLHHRIESVISRACVSQTPDIIDQIMTAIPYHPIFQSFKAEISRCEEKRVTIIEKRDWRKLLEVTTLPDPNSIVMSRSNVEMSQGVAKFAKILFQTAHKQRAKDIWFLNFESNRTI